MHELHIHAAAFGDVSESLHRADLQSKHAEFRFHDAQRREPLQ
jgi:hypothetical protein